MEPTWTSLLPPIITLVLAFATHRIMFSLICGILSAAFIITNFSIINTIKLSLHRIWLNTELNSLRSWKTFWENEKLFLFLFIIAVGIIVALISYSGGTYAYSKLMKKKAKSKKNVEASTVALSGILFIDEFFNSITVGSVMHKLTDSFKIPRIKLAFLVDSMAAPLCILFPISSWIAIIIMQIKKSGVADNAMATTLVSAKPIYLYLNLIPYIFYSFILIIAVFFIIRKSISFGLMKKHEDIANKTGDVFGGGKPIVHKMEKHHMMKGKNTSIIDFIFPIATLFICVLAFFLYFGKYKLFGGNNNLLEAFQNTSTEIALFWGSIIALLASFIFLLIRRKIKFSQLGQICWDGTELMLTSIIILILAWALGGMLSNDLKTGEYLANTILSSFNIRLLPAMYFLTSLFITFAIGSSWGTIAILFPIAVPMIISLSGLSTPIILSQLPILLPTLGAILAGAVAGDQTAPTAQTTIMSASSSGADLMDHIRSQLTYAYPVIIATTISFVISGFLVGYGALVNLSVSLGSGIIICLIMLKIFDYFANKK
jgi:tetracycline resistance efflux pump